MKASTRLGLGAILCLAAATPALAQTEVDPNTGSPRQLPRHADRPNDIPGDRPADPKAAQDKSNCLNNPSQLPPVNTRYGQPGIPQKVGALVGKAVVGSDNEEVGKVHSEVTPHGCSIQGVLVMTPGLVLALGSKQINIPIDALEDKGDRLVAKTMTAAELRKLPRTDNPTGTDSPKKP
jgi:hypothetical protein